MATRGMDHLRNRVTLEINARINDDAEFKAELYGGYVSAEPNKYEGKEVAVRRCEDTFAVGDSVGMCRFTTQLFNSPSLASVKDFSRQLRSLTGIELDCKELLSCGRNVIALERMINAYRGLTSADDTLPKRWFVEPGSAGPFSGEKIEETEFNSMKERFYKISGFEPDGLPNNKWWQSLSEVLTGYTLKVNLPGLKGVERQSLMINRPVGNLKELRSHLMTRLPKAAKYIDDLSMGFAINSELIVGSEKDTLLNSGDEVTLMPMISGG